MNALLETNENVFVSVPRGSGKSILAEIAFYRAWKDSDGGVCVVITPNAALCEKMHRVFKRGCEAKLGVDCGRLTAIKCSNNSGHCTNMGSILQKVENEDSIFSTDKFVYLN